MRPVTQGNPRSHICRHCSGGKRQIRGTLMCPICDGNALTLALVKPQGESGANEAER